MMFGAVFLGMSIARDIGSFVFHMPEEHSPAFNYAWSLAFGIPFTAAYWLRARKTLSAVPISTDAA